MNVPMEHGLMVAGVLFALGLIGLLVIMAIFNDGRRFVDRFQANRCHGLP